ncbi:MAG: cysteine--tRNA ligase [Candidatus Diapherotrites archaeon]|nr:cysteine--tRNA ligase [Candidatus Diapherotrites archaeon]
MVLKVFNTLGRKKMVFKPIEKGKVRMYSCGPTVYDVPHIGNYRSFLMSDMIRRYLEFKGYKVKLVMNLTDIDDKTIKRSGEEGLGLREFTDRYIQLFFEGLDSLNIKRATIYPRATETVPQMIELIKKLFEKGLAYEGKDAVYYSIAKFPGYGKLSGIDLSQVKAGARVAVDEYDKEHPGDFALWKKSSPEEIKRGIYFESPWGKGRPGWHIECSAMSMAYLGETIDIHTGGVDLVFPHHENEIAQSEGATGKPFVHYWLHGEHLLVNGAKMSKSKGNYFTLETLLKRYTPDEIRYFFLLAHYRDKLNYTESAMKNAVMGAEKIKNALEVLGFLVRKTKELPLTSEDKEMLSKLEARRKEFIQAMDDDFNTPLALKTLHALVTDIFRYTESGKNKKVLEKSLDNLKELLGVLGLFEHLPGPAPLSKEELELITKREELRKMKKWEEADKIRKKLKELGILLDDFPEGTRWKRA